VRSALVGVGVVVLLIFTLPLVAVFLSPQQAASASQLCGTLPVGPLSSGDTLTAEQAKNATTIVGTALNLGAGQQGAVVAVITAVTESGLINLDHGLTDSLGLFQQRASQGWGTPAQEMDPVQATTMFITHLLAVPGWQQMPPGVAAQTVQRSAYPDRYAMHLSEGQAIVADLTGTCSTGVAGYVSPFGGPPASWAPSRIDEGVDELPLAPAPILAIGPAVVTYSSTSSGWPGGAFVTYQLTGGPKAGLHIYEAEHLINLPAVGTVLAPGQQIATALPGYPWTESGWAAPTGPSPCSSCAYNGAPDGTATPGGKAFARFLIELGVNTTDPGPGPDTP
jgi:hypothetical protein